MKYLLALAPICALLLSTGCAQSPEKLVDAGNRYHNAKKYQEAYILYQKAITKNKTYAEAYYRQGINLLDQNNAVEASKYLRRAIDLKPDNVDAETKLAEIYLSAYASDPRRMKPLLPDIKELDDKILSHQPNSFAGLRLKALLYLAQDDKQNALTYFEKANQIQPYSTNLVGWYAQTLASMNRAPEAEALVRDMLAHDKNWGAGYDFLFVTFMRSNAKDKAEQVLRDRVTNDPKNAIAVQNLANYLVSTGRFDEGETVIKRVLGDKTNFPNAREIMGDFYVRSRKFDQALQQYQAGVNEDSKDKLAYQQRIVAVYTATNRHDDALKLAKVLATENPKNPSANEMYAALLIQAGTPVNVTNAINELKTLSQNNPSDGALHLDLARAYMLMNQEDKSLSEALLAMQEETKDKAARPAIVLASRMVAAKIYEDKGQNDKALEQTTAVMSAEPNNPEARLLNDRALIGLNQSAKAQPDLESLTAQYPQMGDAFLELGNLYLNQKQYEKATADYNTALKINPNDQRAFVALQAVKLYQGNGDQAIQTMQDLVNKNPQSAAYRYQLANFETTAGAEVAQSNPDHAKQLFQQAADNYKEILKTTTNSPDLWLRLGTLQRQLGQYDAALASFEQAGNADPHRADPPLNEAMLLDNLGKKKEAADAYNKVLGIDPENALALNNLAFMNADNGTNLDQAMTFAERAKKRAPNSLDISDTLGFVYYKKNLNTEALQIFRQIVQDQPQNSTFRFHLAMALLKSGDKQAAKDEAEKALKTASQPDQQNKIRSFVNQIG